MLVPNDSDFRTLYLLRWLCRMPPDIESSSPFIVQSLLNLMTLNVADSVLTEAEALCLNLLGFLGGLPLSECGLDQKR